MTLRVRLPGRLRRLLERVARHVATAEGFTTGSLSIAVVGRRAMATLHTRYAGAPGATDVLAFDLGSDRRAATLDAEIVVCADVARRAARRRGGAPAVYAELALYVVHGVLHVAGYDDHTPTGFARMHAREDDLLTECGLGAVFQKPDGGCAP